MTGKQKALLAAFREVGMVRLACDVAKVGRSSHYRWLEGDAEYRKAFDMVKKDAADILEDEAVRRAIDGVERPTGWYKGKPGGYVREYSDNLLMFLLKWIKPDKYKDRIQLKGGLATIDLNKLPDELIARIAAGEHPLSVLATVEPIAIESGQPQPGTD